MPVPYSDFTYVSHNTWNAFGYFYYIFNVLVIGLYSSDFKSIPLKDWMATREFFVSFRDFYKNYYLFFIIIEYD